jgi:hypothetical protein
VELGYRFAIPTPPHTFCLSVSDTLAVVHLISELLPIAALQKMKASCLSIKPSRVIGRLLWFIHPDSFRLVSDKTFAPIPVVSARHPRIALFPVITGLAFLSAQRVVPLRNFQKCHPHKHYLVCIAFDNTSNYHVFCTTDDLQYKTHFDPPVTLHIKCSITICIGYGLRLRE